VLPADGVGQVTQAAELAAGADLQVLQACGHYLLDNNGVRG
jgi:hypothetical protein